MRTSETVRIYSVVGTVNASVEDGYARPIDAEAFAAIVDSYGDVTIWVPCHKPNSSWGWNVAYKCNDLNVSGHDVPGIYGGPGYRAAGQRVPESLKAQIRGILV